MTNLTFGYSNPYTGLQRSDKKLFLGPKANHSLRSKTITNFKDYLSTHLFSLNNSYFISVSAAEISDEITLNPNSLTLVSL